MQLQNPVYNQWGLNPAYIFFKLLVDIHFFMGWKYNETYSIRRQLIKTSSTSKFNIDIRNLITHLKFDMFQHKVLL